MNVPPEPAGSPGPTAPSALQQHLPTRAWDPGRQARVAQDKASVPRMRPVYPSTRPVPFPSSGPGVVSPSPPSPRCLGWVHGGQVLDPRCASSSPRAAQQPRVGFVPSNPPIPHVTAAPPSHGTPKSPVVGQAPMVTALPQDFPPSPAQAGQPQTGDTGVGGDRRTCLGDQGESWAGDTEGCLLGGTCDPSP